MLPPQPEELAKTWELPLELRIALGRYAAAGAPVPAEWALAWVYASPTWYPRTPAERCASEFTALFRARYGQRFGAGMVVKATTSRITLLYRPASAGMRGLYEATVGDLPDVARLDGPASKLKELAEECTDALDAYSRLLGRQPEVRGTASAIGLLPGELIDAHGGSAVRRLRTWITDLLAGKRAAVADVDELIELWSPGREDKLAKREAVALAALLEKLGAGIEPDVRFGGSTPKPGSPIVLFRVESEASATPSSGYAAAAVLVRLAAALAAADGTVSDGERKLLADHLEGVLGLDSGECMRLDALLLWLSTQKVSLGGMARRLESLDAPERESIGHFLVEVAAADGQITPDEITMLTKLYKVLRLDESDVYRVVHAFESGDSEPVTVRSISPDDGRWSLPPQAAPGEVRLDHAKIAARREETARVAALLGEIFVDDEEGTTPISDPAPVATGRIMGLDSAHSQLVDALRDQLSWSRADVESAAAAAGIPMLDAALDRINDAVLEACGEPLIDGHDPIEINDYALQEIR